MGTIQKEQTEDIIQSMNREALFHSTDCVDKKGSSQRCQCKSQARLVVKLLRTLEKELLVDDA